jgi:hypothetical protein
MANSILGVQEFSVARWTKNQEKEAFATASVTVARRFR